jgi:hypothetical protein
MPEESFKRRLGFFCVIEEILDSQPKMLVHVFRHCVVKEAKRVTKVFEAEDGKKKTQPYIRYLAYCHLFEEVPEGEKPPEYFWQGRGNNWKAKKKKDEVEIKKNDE